jgi:hypothetical protein
MTNSCTHIVFVSAAANPVGAAMRSLWTHVATGSGTTNPYSLTETCLR